MLPLEQNNRLGVRFVVHAVALALLLLGVVTYFLAIQHPLLHQHRDALARSEQLVALLSDAARVRHAHFKSEKQLAELLNNVRRVRQCTPETADDAHFLSELVQLAEVDGLQLVDYRRGRTSTALSHSHVEFELKVVGGYSSICRFVKHLEEMPRTLRMSQLRLQSGGDQGTYKGDMRIMLFYGLHESQEPTREDA